MSKLARVVETAIMLADSGVTKLPPSVLAIKGHGSKKVSIFLNALCCQIHDCRYLEMGTFAGRSLAAAAWGNTGVYMGVDKLQWLGSTVSFDSTEHLKEELKSSLRLCASSNVGVIESDFRLFKPEFDAYDVFFYDADHGYEATRDGTAMMLPYLKPGVLIMDDYHSHAKSSLVQQGMLEALAGAKVEKSWELTPKRGWHTGIYVAVIG